MTHLQRHQYNCKCRWCPGTNTNIYRVYNIVILYYYLCFLNECVLVSSQFAVELSSRRSCCSGIHDESFEYHQYYSLRLCDELNQSIAIIPIKPIENNLGEISKKMKLSGNFAWCFAYLKVRFPEFFFQLFVNFLKVLNNVSVRWEPYWIGNLLLLLPLFPCHFIFIATVEIGCWCAIEPNSKPRTSFGQVDR